MIQRFTILALAGALAACVAAPTVKTDFDRAANFSTYKTYTWLPRPTQGPTLTQQRIVEGIDARLQAKGWKLTDNGDVRVAAQVSTQEKESFQTYYNGVGYGLGFGGFGPPVPMAATTTVDTYEVGTLVVDMFDAKTKRAVWRGSATGTLPDNPDKLPALLQTSLDKMFAAFPPSNMPSR
ncbi:DUF4136 domain-containing protein [Variovorax rhizosphaerae]|uniref:DUF4136 domain-containing protein n=1 Tax=Variovorax rhizosphaerae TaxID=1836200 RepID=A0ABU8WML6_9BURK